MSQEVKKEVLIRKSAETEYSNRLPSMRGRVLKVIQPGNSPDLKPTRVMVQLERGPIVNFRIKDTIEISKGEIPEGDSRIVLTEGDIQKLS